MKTAIGVAAFISGWILAKNWHRAPARILTANLPGTDPESKPRFRVWHNGAEIALSACPNCHNPWVSHECEEDRSISWCATGAEPTPVYYSCPKVCAVCLRPEDAHYTTTDNHDGTISINWEICKSEEDRDR